MAVQLVLVGFGLVARRFVELLLTQTPVLRRRYGLEWTILGIATQRHGAAVDPAGLDPRKALTAADRDELRHVHPVGEPPLGNTQAVIERAATLSDGRVVVVENTPLGLAGGQPGLDHVRVALASGADVITANKGPAAFAYRELNEAARAAGRSFRFEGAVLDGLPVFSLLEQTLPTVAVRGFRGIVNTTTNHVLSAMERGQSLEVAVAEMQAAGIAEADPSNDIDGWDAAAKAAVLANALMEADLTPHDVTRTGLRDVRLDAINDARRRGRRVKLVASASHEAGRVAATVQPVELDADDPLANLNGTAKGLQLDTDLLGPVQISKSHSGVDHTAFALLADLVAVVRERAPGDKSRETA